VPDALGDANVIAAVMAGGRSRRLGGDKATAQLAGRPLISHPIEALSAAGLEPVIVAKQMTRLPDLAVPVWREPDEPFHPLCGIIAALERAEGASVIACGCDMPFLVPGLIRALAERDAPLVVPRTGDGLHPLLARYDGSLLGPLCAALDARSPLQETVAALEPVVLNEEELRRFGDPARLLFNVNTPADLARAEELLREES
jgi:molybdopterin-guanine dinucleotide biosynthesis protein A